MRPLTAPLAPKRMALDPRPAQFGSRAVDLVGCTGQMHRPATRSTPAAAQMHRPDAPARCTGDLHRLATTSRRQPRRTTPPSTQTPDLAPYYAMKSTAVSRLTRPRVPGQLRRFTKVLTNMLAIRRPRTPCRPAEAWAMFLTNDCYKFDMKYNYVITT